MKMTRPLLLLSMISLILFLVTSQAMAQNGQEDDKGKEKASAPQKVTPKEVTLDAKEIDKIARLLGDIDKVKGIPTLKAIKKMAKLKEQFSTLLEKIEKSKRNPLKAVTSWWHVFSSEKFIKFRGRNGRQANKKWSFSTMGRELQVVYQLLVPSTYRNKKPHSLVLCLHPIEGKFRSEDYTRQMWSTKELQSGPLLLAPEFPKTKKGVTARWSDRKFLYASLGVLGHINLEYNIDPNRWFLDGYREGAIEAWRLASLMSDNFAGVIIRGALPPEDIRLEDFINTAFLLIGVPGADLDPKKANELAEKMKAVGVDVTVANLSEAPKPRREREAFKEIAGAQLEFVGKIRNPYPKTLNWSVKENNTRRHFFVKSTSEIEAEACKDEKDRKTPPYFHVTVDRPGNKLVIKTHRVRGLEISLNDLILDLDKEVTFQVNGKVLFNGKPRRTFDSIEDSYQSSGDWSRIYPWKHLLEIPEDKKSEDKKPGEPEQKEDKKKEPDTNGEGR